MIPMLPIWAMKAWLKPLMWVLLALAILAGVMGVLSYVRHAEEAKAEVKSLNEKLGTALYAAKSNEGAFNTCKAVNHQNEKKSAQARLQAAQGVIRIAELELAASQDVKDIHDEAETFRTELGCAALTSEFRDWLRGNP